MAHGDYGTSQMPLAGAIICCTAIAPEQRTALGTIGSAMGATIKLDLTSDVTHLVVGNINSAKYRYVAKSREDVKVLHSDWIEAVRDVWMEGGDVDVAAIEEQHRLPTFFGLRICLTGFDDPEQRKHIQDTVSQNGADYHGDLTKTVTHLIAASPTGKKYEHAVGWQMKIVSWEWFEQSVARRMALDEQYFHPSIPAEQRGKGAWDHQRSTSPMLGKRARELGETDIVNPMRRKLRRSASSKLGSQSEALWAGIMTGSLEKKRKEEDDWTDANVTKPELLPLNDSHAQATGVTQADSEPTADPTSAVVTRGPFLDDEDGIFAGRLVFPHGFDKTKTKILGEHLDGNGAVVIRDATELQTSTFSKNDLRRGYLVIPHDVAVDPATLPEGAGALTLVTNWWVERCLHGKRLVDPSDCVLCRPFDEIRISGFEGLTINLTGFTGIELLQVTKAVALFGATNDDFLSPRISVMICNTRKPNPDKIKYATDKRIPAVHASWLWESISCGRVQPYDDFLLGTTVLHPQKPKQKPHQASLPEVPTAPLSEEDSLKIRKKIQAAKQAAKPRGGGLRRHGTLELSLSGPPAPGSTAGSSATIDSNLQRDGQLPLMCDGAISQPLRDINPSVNSPRRPSTSSSSSTYPKPKMTEAQTKPATAQRNLRRTRNSSPESVIPIATDSVSVQADLELPSEDEPSMPAPELAPQVAETDYADMMSKLLANRKTTAPGEKEEETGRRKRRPLGRAQSTRSNTSTADQSSASKALEVHREANETKTDNEAHAKPFEIPLPSQELGWDSPFAAQKRVDMIRAVGGKVDEKSRGLTEVGGVVRDKVDVDESVGGRARRRKRG